MRKNLYLITLLLLVSFAGCRQETAPTHTDTAGMPPEAFMRISGADLITPQGEKFLIRGTNLGNWLNPEGYMFGFNKTNSPGRINRMFCEMVGPDFTAEFWKAFKDNYITRDDVQFIAGTGANTIRLPFHYKLFTDEDYMGLTVNQDGFARIDSVVNWCRETGLYLILDMHDAPGGQTGDNIDDSYGYPWLFESETSQQLFCHIWKKIAAYYKNEPVILGYELMNEPIAPYFSHTEELNGKLEPLYKRAVAAIREVDSNHIILLGGAQWNGNFRPFTDSTFDDKIMYTCHRYGGEATKSAIGEIIAFRDRVNLPMYMGEIGHNTVAWQNAFCHVMQENNIGWTFWPYKKIDDSSFAGIKAPENWDRIVAFSEAPRSTYQEMRKARPDQEKARTALMEFIENCRLQNCVVQKEYLRSLCLKVQ